MTHKQDPSLAPQSLQSALDMDQSQPSQQSQHQASNQTTKKRKKTDSNNDQPSEPRRLRRSHEACARCRSKKIKCDSKYPRCTACATAGVPCEQEDRHRQTLTPRGYTERIEFQLKQCQALLSHFISGFDLENIDELCAQKGIHIDPSNPDSSPAFQFGPPPRTQYPLSPKGYAYPPPPPGMIPPYPGGPIPYGAPYPPHPHIQGHPGPYDPRIHPSFQPPPQPQQMAPMPPPPPVETPGQDPKRNDMTHPQALAINFGVSEEIINSFTERVRDDEDLAVGSSGLRSGRDRRINEASLPRTPSRWMSVSLPRDRVESVASGSPPLPSIQIWLPKDRKMVNHIVGVYFNRLNYHRPALDEGDFEKSLHCLYDGEITSRHDQGFICTLYLVLALGTLNEVNHRAIDMDKDRESPASSPTVKKRLMPEGWPEHDEFFEWGLFYKPEIQATISALQALILLHWYLYTERQGRTLWRFVGGIVRLAIELGLHHEPSTQGVFTEEESQLRIRLWGIVMVHDRGTSILLGRPLGIAPYDSNTSRPSQPKTGKAPFSEHFLLSHPIAEIQADIINSLYTPTSQSPDQTMRQASRIIKSMVEIKRQLPEQYQRYFKGSEDLNLDQRKKLVEEITADEGLTLLKIGISRILLLRVLFNSEALPFEQRQKCLVDAIVTAHNIIVIHNHLIRFPDIGFFVSPIPLHIAAMVILCGHLSQLHRLQPHVEVQDIWMALDVLPRMRWRWERKDVNGEHPMIAQLAERILSINLRDVVPTGDHMLLSEQDWDSEISLLSPSIAVQKQEQVTPVMRNVPFPIHGGNESYGTPSRDSHSNGPMTRLKPDLTDGRREMAIPSDLFYPFYPERSVQNGPQDFQELLAAAGAQGGPYSSESYLPNGGPNVNHSRMPGWTQRGVPYPINPQ